MKNVLFICNTHYQLIIAIQMRLTLMKEDACYVLITDRSKGAESVSEKLRKVGLFRDVFFQKVRDPKGDRASFAERLYYVRCGVFGSKDYLLNPNIVFDEIIGFNLDLHSHLVFASEYRKNKKLICEKMEEGLLSYSTAEDSSGVLKTIYKIRRILGKANMRTLVSKFYCLQPVAYKGRFQSSKIPNIDVDDEKIKIILPSIFSDNTANQEYREKYIFLPCVYDFEGGAPIGELELAVKIAQKVGADNLLVKVHPRDDATRYREVGLNVAANSSIPWEVIQINHDFSDKVLLSTLSTSLLTTSSLFSEPPKSYYLFPLCDVSDNPLAQHYKKVVEEYLVKAGDLGLKNIDICEDLDKILSEF